MYRVEQSISPPTMAAAAMAAAAAAMAAAEAARAAAGTWLRRGRGVSGGAGFSGFRPSRTESSAPSPSPASRSLSCADRPEREVAVVICHTGCRCSRSCVRFRRSLSRILKTSSSLGSVNGLRSASSQFPAISNQRGSGPQGVPRLRPPSVVAMNATARTQLLRCNEPTSPLSSRRECPPLCRCA